MVRDVVLYPITPSFGTQAYMAYNLTSKQVYPVGLPYVTPGCLACTTRTASCASSTMVVCVLAGGCTLVCAGTARRTLCVASTATEAAARPASARTTRGSWRCMVSSTAQLCSAALPMTHRTSAVVHAARCAPRHGHRLPTVGTGVAWSKWRCHGLTAPSSCRRSRAVQQAARWKAVLVSTASATASPVARVLTVRLAARFANPRRHRLTTMTTTTTSAACKGPCTSSWKHKHSTTGGTMFRDSMWAIAATTHNHARAHTATYIHTLAAQVIVNDMYVNLSNMSHCATGQRTAQCSRSCHQTRPFWRCTLSERPR